MPKLNITHLSERLKERLEKLERGEEVSKKDIEALLDDKQIKQLNKLLGEQESLRQIHKRPKTKEEERAIGWKTKLEVRIEIYKQAIEEAIDRVAVGIRKLQEERETKAARIYLDAYFKAKQGADKASAGNIALTRAGFNKPSQKNTKRDKEVWVTEEALRKQFESELTDKEKEQLAMVREIEKFKVNRTK